MLALTRRYPAKRAFITGAASGLGASLSRKLAADGWTIGVTDVRAEPLEQIVKAVEAAGGKAIPFVFDVSDRQRYAEVVEAFLSNAGGIDLLVNNAGVAGAGLIGEYALEDWEWLYRINVFGPIYGSHLFAAQFKKQRSGHIINIASAAALFPVPGMGAYCSGKAALKMFSEVLSNELKPEGVDVSVVMPDFFQTNLHEGMRGQQQEVAKRLITRSKFTADDVADVVLEEAGGRELYIPFPRRTRFLWWLQRANPAWVSRLLVAFAPKKTS